MDEALQAGHAGVLPYLFWFNRPETSEQALVINERRAAQLQIPALATNWYGEAKADPDS